ncbi:MAG TPA: serine hydrolase domain-containing protein [Candidatus Limnocylindrales bacterium]
MADPDLGALLAKHASALSIPGAALGVLRDGVTTVATYGIEDVRTDAPVEAGSRFSAGSLTKTMVATVVARLAAQGRLGLEDSVASHVPELDGAGWARTATLRELLANRSGLPLRVGLDFDFECADSGDDALARFAARVAAEESTPVPYDPDNPTVTFGAFDAEGRPQVLYEMLWGLPRTDASGRSATGRRRSGHGPDARSAVDSADAVPDS